MMIKHIVRYLILMVIGGVLLACDGGTSSSPAGPTVLESIRTSGELIVVTRNAPTTYYEWRDEIVGFEHDMIASFARYLDVKVRYIIKDSPAEILEALENGEAHIAAAGLTATEERSHRFAFGPVYQSVQQQVVCRRGGKRPKSVEALVDVKLVVPASTSYVEHLTMLKQTHPDISWTETNEYSTENLLERVWEKKLDCTVADSNIVAINRRYYPELIVRFDLSEPQSLVWLMPKHAEDLNDEVNTWFEEYEDLGRLEALHDQYYGYIEVFDYVDTKKFVKRIQKVLPKYRKNFESEANKYGIDWTLLAAQAYQESHWRANARSPTGVRGIMMLTRTTAKEVGIKNRLDPVQSIKGGSKYLSKLIKRIPESVQGPERIWFALAAYNVGMGHVYDARELARRQGKNPDKWSDVAEVLPLLSQKKYYKTVKHGYARGSEPVRYVQRIRDYQNILIQNLNNGSVQ